MESLLKGLSQEIIMGSTNFDIDETGEVTSALDILVNKKLIKKGLENDSLYFQEGGLNLNDAKFIDESEYKNEFKEHILD